MEYLDDKSIADFLHEVSVNYNKIIDSNIIYLDGDISLNNMGRGYKLDNRLKTKEYKVFRCKTIHNICANYKLELISMEEAIRAIKAKITAIKGGELV